MFSFLLGSTIAYNSEFNLGCARFELEVAIDGIFSNWLHLGLQGTQIGIKLERARSEPKVDTQSGALLVPRLKKLQPKLQQPRWHPQLQQPKLQPN